MVNRLDLRVHGVNTNEITQLSNLLARLPDGGYQNDLVDSASGMPDFVLTMKPASLPEIKNVLHDLLQVVASERIVIET